MAIIKCKECGKDVSDKATTCPNCGVSINKITINTDVNTKIDNKKAIGIIVGIILLVVGLLLYFNGMEEILGSTGTTKNNDRVTYDKETNMYMYRIYP